VSALAAAVVAALDPGEATSYDGFGPVTVDVPRERWVEALEAAHAAGAVFFDLLTAYDLGPDGLAVVVHLATADARDHLLVRTTVPGDDAVLPTATGVYRGAAWHERETHEMFGVGFLGHVGLDPLLLDPDVVTTPLRKGALLMARLAAPWPGDVDPGDAAGRPRRRTPPPGVPIDWEGS